MYISDLDGLVNNDTAEVKLEKCVDFLSSKLDFGDIAVTKGIKNENDIFLVHSNSEIASH